MTHSIHSQVVVWGGGSGGVAAALQAARSGAVTLLLTPGPWLGGMLSAAGVCAPDGNELTPWQTGLWGSLLRALAREEPDGLDHNWVSCFGFRPASAEAILRRWVGAESRLQWWPDCRLLEVNRDGRRIAGLQLERRSGDEAASPSRADVKADLVIDGSDRGDLFPLAGAPFRLGWEEQERWGEPSAPRLETLTGDPFFRQQPVQSPTWVAMGRIGPGAPASGHGVAAPFEEATARFGLERTITYGRLPGGVVMLNWPLHGNDWHRDPGRAFVETGNGNGDTTQQALNQEMRDHSLAFLAALSEASGGWLQAAEVFPTPAEASRGALEGRQSLALMPYWREGRRLVGLETVVEQHLLPLGAGASRGPLCMDGAGRCTSVAVGNYANDHHYPGGDWPLAAKSCRWGGRWSGTPFTVPYGALVSAELDNLLAADKCLSVSHMANGATRLQPLVLNIGQAAGLAAALCLEKGIAPAQLPVRDLQEALLGDPQAPAGPVPLWDTPWHHPAWRQRQRAVLDQPDALDASGSLRGDPAVPSTPPQEPHERCWSGRLRPEAGGGFSLEAEGECWSVITLEPDLNRWLQGLDGPRQVVLIGCLNPWGPWLRASRLAEG